MENPNMKDKKASCLLLDLTEEASIERLVG